MTLKQKIKATFSGEMITIELDDSNSPKTVSDFIKSLPFSVESHIWGEEIYTDSTPISQSEENAKPIVSLNDVAYWPTGKAICLFYGPTPIGTPGEITPYSPVNVIGKIVDADKSILSRINEGEKITFESI